MLVLSMFCNVKQLGVLALASLGFKDGIHEQGGEIIPNNCIHLQSIMFSPCQNIK
jgi:hypothetical protein